MSNKIIKVGQVWKSDNPVMTIAITYIDKRNSRKPSEWDYYYIFKDGETVACDEMYFVKIERKCVAEYPTWQEAVNSKEFKE